MLNAAIGIPVRYYSLGDWSVVLRCVVLR